MNRYTLGVDFGTLSARAVVLDLDSGIQIGESVSPYDNKVIEDFIPNTTISLGKKWALQNPNDYLKAFIQVVTDISKQGIDIEKIIGIGIDFTSCTVLPVNSNGDPLCNDERWAKHPHAWVKLWKHHAAQLEADRINQLAKEKSSDWIEYYGGKISSEWLFPKLLQICEEDYELYKHMDYFIEAGDWLIWQLTGNQKRSLTMAGYKAIYDPETGFPEKDFFKELNPLFENVVEEKLQKDYYPITSKAGGLKKKFANLTGLKEGTPISIANIDAHVAVVSTGVLESGQLLSVIGTSSCDIALSTEKKAVPGVSGVVLGGAGTDLYAYESGQNAVGDIFQWFVDELVPMKFYKEAQDNDITVFELLERKASKLNPGSEGLLCLDWQNGSRSVLMDTDLSGLILGLSLKTKPEEIYRALIEGTAFAKRQIIETYIENGILINEIILTGGISFRNKMLNQIYADVIGKKIYVSPYLQTPAIGAALFGAVVAIEGFSLEDAYAVLKEDRIVYNPNLSNHKIYNELYKEYLTLHDYFGRGENDVMKRLLSHNQE